MLEITECDEEETLNRCIIDLAKFMFPEVLNHDHAVQIYYNSQPLSITFTVSKYLSETLAQFLRRLRLEKGLKQNELAKKLRVGKVTVYNWENDRKKPSRKSMERLARFFNIRAKRFEDLGMERKRGLSKMYD